MKFNQLPSDAISQILSYLTFQEAITASSTSKKWRSDGSIIGFEYNNIRKVVQNNSTEATELLWNETYQRRLETYSNVILEASKKTGENLSEATLPTLVHLLCSTHINDKEFCSVFFYLYRCFATSAAVLREFLVRFRYFEDLRHKFKAYVRLHTREVIHVCRAITKFVMVCMDDLVANDEIPILKQVIAFIDTQLMQSDLFILKVYAQYFKHNWDKQIQQAAKLKSMFKFKESDEQIDIGNIFDISVDDMAKQLTIQEYESFLQLKPYDLCGVSWRQASAELRNHPVTSNSGYSCAYISDSEDNQGHRKSRPHSVLKILQRFQGVSLWVAMEIVEYTTANERAQAISRFIALAQRLLQLKNFQTTFAVCAGLMGASVHRLKQTRDMLPPEDSIKWEAFRDIVSLIGNFRSLRRYINKAERMPCVPYLGMFLSDLVAIRDRFAMDSFRRGQSIVIPRYQFAEHGGSKPVNVINPITFLNANRAMCVNWNRLRKEYQVINRLQLWQTKYTYFNNGSHNWDIIDPEPLQHPDRMQNTHSNPEDIRFPFNENNEMDVREEEFVKLHSVQQWLEYKHSFVIDEDQLYQRSLQREPRE